MTIIIALTIGVAIFVPKVSDLNAKKTEMSKKVIAHYEAELVKLDLNTFKKDKITKDSLKDGIVVLNFWASWCTPCLEEFPSLVKFKDEFKDNSRVRVIAINSDEDEIDKNIKKVIKKYNINFDIVKDIKAKITDSFMISAIPVSITFYNGKVIEISNGAKDFYSAEYIEKVKELLK